MKKICALLLIIFAAGCITFVPACSPDKSGGSVSSYTMYVSYDEAERKLTGTVDFDYFNSTENELSDLKFNLYGAAFGKESKFKPVSESYKNRAYYAGTDYGDMEISNVENCAGWNVAGEDENILIVNLNSPLYPEERVKLKISYTLKLARVNHRTGVTADAVNLGNFYPVLCAYTAEGFIECPYYSCGDPFMSECADYNVTIDVPENYIIASSGTEKSSSAANGRKKYQYILKKARDFALVLSTKFKVLEAEQDGVDVKYYYLSDGSPEKSLSAAAQSLGYFNDVFGKYVYPSLSVVETGFCYGGMEYPALTMIAKGLSEDERYYTIVHENAHQWWYAMVGNNQLTDAWQDEGLAEYSSLLFFENNPDYGYTRTSMIGTATRSYRTFFSVYGQLNGKTDTSMNRNLGAYSGDLEYCYISYNKGMLLFDMLRRSMGDKAFMNCLSDYFSTYKYKIASSDDIIGVFAASGADVEGVFRAFIDGKIII